MLGVCGSPKLHVSVLIGNLHHYALCVFAAGVLQIAICVPLSTTLPAMSGLLLATCDWNILLLFLDRALVLHDTAEPTQLIQGCAPGESLV